jgi:two-component system LytT family response regulator
MGDAMSEPATEKLAVVIVDDEAPARSLLRELLATHADVDVVAECANGFEAVKAVTERHPDLLLIDIQMPKLDGFEVLELIGDEVAVIFVTAFDQHAIRAFEIHAVDYVLKPLDAERLSAALARARERIGKSETLPVREIVSAGRGGRGDPIQRILIRDKARVHVIPIGRVDYIEAQDDYVAVKTGELSLLKEQPLADLEKGLNPTRFVRIHRRYILQIDRLARIDTTVTNSRIAVLTNQTRLPTSRSGYRRLTELLEG